MATSDPAELEAILRRISATIAKVSQTVTGMQKVSQILANQAVVYNKHLADRQKLFERNKTIATEIAAIEKNLATVIYPTQLRNAELLNREMENLQKRAKLTGTAKAWEDEGKQMAKLAKDAVVLEQAMSNLQQAGANKGQAAALKDPGYRKDLAAGTVGDQRSQNLGERKRLVGLEGAMKSGQLQPLIKETVQLEVRAKALEKALQWERLKAEKGTIGAYFDTVKGKLSAVWAVAGKAGAMAGQIGAGFKSAFAGVGNIINTLAMSFSQLRGAMVSTVQLAAPGPYIRYEMALKDLSAVIGQILRPAFEDLTRAIRHIADVLISLPQPVKDLISSFAKFGLVITAVGGAAVLLAPLFTAMTTGITSLIAVGGTLVTVFGGPVAAAIGAPLLPLIAVAAALTAGVGIWAAYKTGVFESMAAFKPLAGLAATLTGIAKSMEGMFANIVPVLAQIAALGVTAFEGLARAVGPLITAAGNFVKIMMPIGARLLGALGPLVGLLAKIGEMLGGKLAVMANAVTKALGKMGAMLAEKIGPFIASIMPSLMAIGDVIGEMFDAAQPALEEFMNLLTDMFDIFLEYGMPIVSAAIAGIAKSMQMMLPAFKTAMVAVKSTFTMMRELFTNLARNIDATVEKMKDLYLLYQKTNALAPDIDWSRFKFGYTGTTGDGKYNDMAKDFEDAIKKMMGIWNKPEGSSIGAAMRPAQFSSIEEFGRQATLSAYSMGRQETPEEKAIRLASEKAAEGVQKIVDAVNTAALNAANRAVGAF